MNTQNSLEPRHNVNDDWQEPDRPRSINEAADWLGIGRTTMYELVMSGEIASFTIGRRRLVSGQSLLAFARRGDV